MSSTTYYPPPAFAFTVALAVVPGSPPTAVAIDGAFQGVSGIDPKIEIEEVTEGELNSNVHLLPGVPKHSNLLLKRGYMRQPSALAEWAAQAVGSTLGTAITTQVLTVSLIGADAQPMVTWTFQNAWPVKLEVGSFDANRNEVLIETLELAYDIVVKTLVQAAV